MSDIEKKLLDCKSVKDIIDLAKIHRGDRKTVGLIMAVHAEIQEECGHFKFDKKNFVPSMKHKIKTAKNFLKYGHYERSLNSVFEKMCNQRG